MRLRSGWATQQAEGPVNHTVRPVSKRKKKSSTVLTQHGILRDRDLHLFFGLHLGQNIVLNLEHRNIEKPLMRNIRKQSPLEISRPFTRV